LSPSSLSFFFLSHQLRFVWFVIVVVIVCTSLGFRGERERDGVLTNSNGYLNHEVAKKVAHVAGFGEDRVTEL
jgi:hypothetical protein